MQLHSYTFTLARANSLTWFTNYLISEMSGNSCSKAASEVMHSRNPLGWPLRKHLSNLSSMYQNNFFFFACNFAASSLWVGCPVFSHGARGAVHTSYTSACEYAQILYITIATRERGNGTSAREDTPLYAILITSVFCIAVTI